MQREQKVRPSRVPARKIKTDGLDEQSLNIGDTSREDFNLRTDNRDITLGRAAARDAPISAHGSPSRNKELARKFTEHAAKSAETQRLGYNSGDILPVVSDSGSVSAGSQTSDKLPLKQDIDNLAAESHPLTFTAPLNGELLDSSVRNGGDSKFKRKTVNRRQFEKFNGGEPTAQHNTDTPIAETTAESDTKLIFDQSDHMPEVLPESQVLVKDTPLSHERTPRSAPERPNRFRFGGSSAVQDKTPKRKPSSPDAAKYIPPISGEVKVNSEESQSTEPHQADDSPESVKYTQLDTVKPDIAASSTGTPHHKTESSDKLKFKTAETAVLKNEGVPQEKPLHKPVSSDTVKHTPTNAIKTDEAETPKPSDAVSATADGEQPATDTAGTEPEKPSAEQESGKGKKSGANQGSTRSHADKPGKLKFTEDETTPTAASASSDKKLTDRKLEKAEHKAEQSVQKLEKARKNLPKKHSVKIEKGFDVKSGSRDGG